MKDFKSITSRENPLIKLVSSLQKSASARRDSGLMALEGLRICLDAAENGIVLEKLIISQSAREKRDERLSLLEKRALEGYILPNSLFKKIGDTENPQGIMALVKIPRADNAKINRCGKYAALENVSDPSNLGAIARTAEALGADGLIVSGGCDPYSPKTVRASMGTLLRLPVYTLFDFAADLKQTGLSLYACVPERSAESIAEVRFLPGSAVMIGNEANGLTEAAKAASDRLVTIPMTGRAESLNAAAAAAIAIWEMMK